MIGRLTRFELKKTLGGKFFRVALCLMLLLNLLLNCGIREWYELKESIRDGTLLEDAVSEEARSNFFSNFAEVRGVVKYMRKEGETLQNLTPEQWEQLEATLKEKYGEDILDGGFFMPTAQMMASPGSLEGSDINDLSLIQMIESSTAHNTEVEENRQRVLKSAKRLGQDAVKKGDSYNIRRNLRVLKLYAEPRQSSTAPTIRGWSDFLFGSSTMLLVYLMVLLACAGNFSGEKDSQALYLLHTAKKWQD